MPRDQKVLAHDPKHQFAKSTEIRIDRFYCAACAKKGTGAYLMAWVPDCGNLQPIDICRACIRLALYKMAEIPEAQS